MVNVVTINGVNYPVKTSAQLAPDPNDTNVELAFSCGNTPSPAAGVTAYLCYQISRPDSGQVIYQGALPLPPGPGGTYILHALWWQGVPCEAIFTYAATWIDAAGKSQQAAGDPTIVQPNKGTVTEFTTSGSSSFQPGADGTYLIECIGAGGAGSPYNTIGGFGGQGGNGGNYAQACVNLLAAQTYTVVVGGAAAGDSSFGGNFVLGAGANSGTPSVGTITRAGGAGGSNLNNQQRDGGGGGGAAGPIGPGTSADNGTGGAGGEKAGAGGNGATDADVAKTGGVYGGGGGGGGNVNSSGATGAPGYVRVTALPGVSATFPSAPSSIATPTSAGFTQALLGTLPPPAGQLKLQDGNNYPVSTATLVKDWAAAFDPGSLPLQVNWAFTGLPVNGSGYRYYVAYIFEVPVNGMFETVTGAYPLDAQAAITLSFPWTALRLMGVQFVVVAQWLDATGQVQQAQGAAYNTPYSPSLTVPDALANVATPALAGQPAQVPA